MFVFTACQNDQNAQIENDATEKVSQSSQFLVTPEEARQSLKNFMDDVAAQTRGNNSTIREIDEIIDLHKFPSTRSTSPLVKSIGEDFYIATFKNDKGYALLSKDKRTSPIFAVLDDGHFSIDDLEESKAAHALLELQVRGREAEMRYYHRWINDNDKDKDKDKDNRPKVTDENVDCWNPYYDHIRDGWRMVRFAEPRLNTKWGQNISEDKATLYINKNGAPYDSVYKVNNVSTRICDKSKVEAYGCTPVAYAQVMYALRNENGFKDLKYTNGEPVLWNNMNPDRSYQIQEVERFIGWITANCSPTYLKEGTMVFNTNAKDFMRKILDPYITSRYQNCIMWEGDFNGYGWKESQKVAEEFFKYPKCFVIMTGSPQIFSKSYHTFVIDGMVELHKDGVKGSGFLGTGLFSKTHYGIRHLYHVNPGWNGKHRGFFLYVQNVNNEFDYYSNKRMNYDSNTAYLIVRPR